MRWSRDESCCLNYLRYLTGQFLWSDIHVSGKLGVMSGHSKWSQIKRSKGAADAKRSQTFGKLANQIAIAARKGADAETNMLLRIAIDRAREANMPKDNIERILDKAKGSGGSAIEDLLFEAYGPEGIAYLIETATDNRNRTTGEIRAVLNKLNGKMAEAGSVSFLFKQRGLLVVDLQGASEESAELTAIDAGAEDIEAAEGKMFVYTQPKELDHVRRSLLEAGLKVEEMSLEWEALSPIVISSQETADKLIKLAEELEALDDVQKVATNFEINQ